MSALNRLLETLKVEASVFHNGQYCGMWAIDTSGSQMMTFHVVTHGSCYLKFDDELVTLNQGDAIFFPSDARHRLSNVDDDEIPLNQAEPLSMMDGFEEDGTGLVCGHFGHSNPVFEKLVGQLPALIVIRAESSSPTARVINLLLQESVSSDQSSNLLLNRLSDCLFYLLLRDHLDVGNGLFAAMAHPKLGRSLELIHKETDSKLTVDELAAEAGMSRSAFAAMFKEVVAQSPIEYITQWRMTQAYRWLADEGISTLEAALRCGYESEASFSKAFKRVMGVGPGQARKAL